jgi:glycosyltransferase involved in cell wall biosynthesis
VRERLGMLRRGQRIECHLRSRHDVQVSPDAFGELMSSGISVIICCHNSSLRLPETLAHLARQVVPSGLSVEAVVVDNASEDGTGETAYGEWSRLHAPFELSIVKEPKAGLSHARRSGLRRARHSVVIFCDDDNWLGPDYVQNAADL